MLRNMVIKELVTAFRKEPWWHLLKNCCIFVLHFMVVMLLLCCAAFVLAKLEDPDIINNNEQQQELSMDGNPNASFVVTANNAREEHRLEKIAFNETSFWEMIRTKYNFSVQEDIKETLLDDFLHHLKDLEEHKDESKSHHKHDGNINTNGKKFIFMKWFYFVIVATTTIGYGHVYPKTDQGKLFYIMFSVIGIVLMMTLLRSCGKIIMAINRKFYKLIRRYLFNKKEYISDPMTSVISMCMIFLVFMLLVVIHDKNIGEVENWSWINTFYFWLVTFTTVGFGDVHFPLEVEIDHFYELVLYRVFGLSFLAGIIESIHEYIKYRKSLLVIKHNKKRLLRKISGQKKMRDAYNRNRTV